MLCNTRGSKAAQVIDDSLLLVDAYPKLVFSVQERAPHRLGQVEFEQGGMHYERAIFQVFFSVLSLHLLRKTATRRKMQKTAAAVAANQKCPPMTRIPTRKTRTRNS